jgi:hypothetical protein
MVDHVLPRTDHAHLAVRTARLGTVPAALALTACGLAAAAFVVLAHATVSFVVAVVAAGLWCRWLERHAIPECNRPSGLLEALLGPPWGPIPYRL